MVVYLLVSLGACGALWANPWGFLAAFGVSFFGHARWTFPTAVDQHARAMRRFFVLAASGFAMNQIVYAWALNRGGARAYLPLLVAVMMVVAVATYVLGRAWAFADARHAAQPTAAP